MEADAEPMEADPVPAEASAEPGAASAGVAEVTEAAALSDREGQRLVSTQTVQHDYLTLNGKVARETITVDGTVTTVMDFIYDESGRPFALNYSDDGGSSFTTYYYVLNLQGDVVKLVTSTGTSVAEYSYDAWGNILTATGELAEINPLRYRGYYFDSETGFYYLQSRYYDPVNRRFINADGYASTGQGFTGTNMFVYCGNAPTNRIDTSGYKWWVYVIKAASGGLINVGSSYLISQATGQEYGFWDGFWDFNQGAFSGAAPEEIKGWVVAADVAVTVIQSINDGDSFGIIVAKSVASGAFAYISLGGLLDVGDGLSGYFATEFVDFMLLFGVEISAEAVLEVLPQEETYSQPIRYTKGGPFIVKNNGFGGGRAAFMVRN